MNYPAKVAYQNPKTAAEYDDRRFTTPWGRTIGAIEIRKMLAGLAVLGAGDGALIVDAPAGTCRLTLEGVRTGRRTIAVDISQAMLAAGLKSRAMEGHPNFGGVVVGDLESLPIRTTSIDAVMCLRLMGHLPLENKRRVVGELLRVSRLGAVIMFARRTRLLRVKRSILVALGLRSGSAPWFDETNETIATLIGECGGKVITKFEVFGPFAESVAYVVTASGNQGG